VLCCWKKKVFFSLLNWAFGKREREEEKKRESLLGGLLSLIMASLGAFTMEPSLQSELPY